MNKYISVFIALLFLAPASASALVADCSGDVGTLIVDTTQQVSNNPDSGMFGSWAVDTFSKRMRVWEEGDHYCGQTDDVGTFVTAGGISPELGAPLAEGIIGTFTGGARYVIHGTFAPVWATEGAVPPKDDGVGGGYSNWVAQYFSGETHDFYSWGWTYNACGHGSWTNADVGNTGEITTDGVDCVPPPPPPFPSHGGGMGISVLPFCDETENAALAIKNGGYCLAVEDRPSGAYDTATVFPVVYEFDSTTNPSNNDTKTALLLQLKALLEQLIGLL